MIADALLLPEPTAEQIAHARHAAGLTQAQACAMLGIAAQPQWAHYESGFKRMSGARWALFLLLADLHPSLRVVERERGEAFNRKGEPVLVSIPKD